MRLDLENGGHVEIECLRIEHDPRAAGDRELAVRMDLGIFTGSVVVWVFEAAWAAFIDQLATLERTRRGSAVLESMGPGELRLEVHSTDALGHMAVRGQLWKRGLPPEARLEFSGHAFEPTQLPRLVGKLQTLAPNR